MTTYKNIADQILAAAQAEVGKAEVGGENRGSNVQRYRQASGNKAEGSAWCADFVSYVMDTSVKGLVVPSQTVEGILSQFRGKKAYHNESGYRPQPGDVVFFEHPKGQDVKGSKRIGHTGIVKAVHSDGSLAIIEGNISDARFDDRQSEAPAWTKEAPDLVRERTWKHGDVKFGNKIVGFGSVHELAIAKGMVVESAVGQAVAVDIRASAPGSVTARLPQVVAAATPVERNRGVIDPNQQVFLGGGVSAASPVVIHDARKKRVEETFGKALQDFRQSFSPLQNKPSMSEEEVKTSEKAKGELIAAYREAQLIGQQPKEKSAERFVIEQEELAIRQAKEAGAAADLSKPRIPTGTAAEVAAANPAGQKIEAPQRAPESAAAKTVKTYDEALVAFGAAVIAVRRNGGVDAEAVRLRKEATLAKEDLVNLSPLADKNKARAGADQWEMHFAKKESEFPNLDSKAAARAVVTLDKAESVAKPAVKAGVIVPDTKQHKQEAHGRGNAPKLGEERDARLVDDAKKDRALVKREGKKSEAHSSYPQSTFKGFAEVDKDIYRRALNSVKAADQVARIQREYPALGELAAPVVGEKPASDRGK